MKKIIDVLLFPFYVLWTIWCAFIFWLIVLLAFPIIYICVMSGNKSLLYKVHFLPPHISTIVLFLWGIRIVEHNKAHVDSTRQMIFVGNHRSYLDALISGSVIKNYKKYIGKAEVLKWPVLGFLLEKLYIPVHREDKNHRAWSMEQLYVKAKEGASIVVFPEGTSNNTSALLKHFHDGAFRLAIPTQLPIMVMTIIGAGEVWNRNVFLLKPGVIHVYWSDPIEMTHYTDIDKDMENLKNVVKSEMLIHLKKHYPDGYKVY